MDKKMTKQSEAVLAKVKFESEDCKAQHQVALIEDIHKYSSAGCENARLLPIIRTLLEVNERLSEACTETLSCMEGHITTASIDALDFRDERMKSLVEEE